MLLTFDDIKKSEFEWKERETMHIQFFFSLSSFSPQNVVCFFFVLFVMLMFISATKSDKEVVVAGVRKGENNGIKEA